MRIERIAVLGEALACLQDHRSISSQDNPFASGQREQAGAIGPHHKHMACLWGHTPAQQPDTSGCISPACLQLVSKNHIPHKA